jgi:uncharacterized protein
MLPIVRTIAEEFKEELQKLYGDDLSALILFGSHARGDFHEESDIDFAVVLKQHILKTSIEIAKIVPISLDLSLKYSQFISFLPISEGIFSVSRLSIHKFIKNQGIKI